MDEIPDIATVFDDHVAAEFVARDLDAAMATMAPDPYVYHVPTMAGGDGHDDVRSFYGTHFIGKWPEDTAITPVSRTVGETQVVDELILSFTHDIEMDAILPGVPPTGRQVTLPFCVVVGFEDGQGEARAHLLGPGIGAGADRADRRGRAARDRRRAGGEPDRPPRGADEPAAVTETD